MSNVDFLYTAMPKSTLQPIRPSDLLRKVVMGCTAVAALSIAFPGQITTVAGNGAETFSGDGGLATSASLQTPSAMISDDSGNLYIADRMNVRVRKVDAKGIITTIAGKGLSGTGGDGGPGTDAFLQYPTGIAIDRSGNLYISDDSNNRIRKLSKNGIITSVAGTGEKGHSGSGPDGDSVDATKARIWGPDGVVCDTAVNLFISEYWGHRVRKVTTKGIITTIAGTGNSGSSGDGGPATKAELDGPTQIALDPSGNLYILEGLGHCVRKIDKSGIISTIISNTTNTPTGTGGTATVVATSYPGGLAVDAAGNIFLADKSNRVQKVTPAGMVSTIVGSVAGYSGDSGISTNAKLNFPGELSLDRYGNLFIADRYNNRIRRIEAIGTTAAIAGKPPRIDGLHGDLIAEYRTIHGKIVATKYVKSMQEAARRDPNFDSPAMRILVVKDLHGNKEVSLQVGTAPRD